MSDDETRKLVLARRAKFIAAAVAGIGVACKTSTPPEPCLSAVPIEQDAAPPMPCLSVAYEPPDASAEAAAPQAPDAEAPPQPCLTPVQRDVVDAGPQPCLKVAQPKKPQPQPCLSVAPKPKQ